MELLGDAELLADLLQDGVGLLDVLHVDAYPVFVHEKDLKADVFAGLPTGLLLGHEQQVVEGWTVGDSSILKTKHG